MAKDIKYVMICSKDANEKFFNYSGKKIDITSSFLKRVEKNDAGQYTIMPFINLNRAYQDIYDYLVLLAKSGGFIGVEVSYDLAEKLGKDNVAIFEQNMSKSTYTRLDQYDNELRLLSYEFRDGTDRRFNDIILVKKSVDGTSYNIEKYPPKLDIQLAFQDTALKRKDISCGVYLNVTGTEVAPNKLKHLTILNKVGVGDFNISRQSLFLLPYIPVKFLSPFERNDYLALLSSSTKVLVKRMPNGKKSISLYNEGEIVDTNTSTYAYLVSPYMMEAYINNNDSYERIVGLFREATRTDDGFVIRSGIHKLETKEETSKVVK